MQKASAHFFSWPCCTFQMKRNKNEEHTLNHEVVLFFFSLFFTNDLDIDTDIVHMLKCDMSVAEAKTLNSIKKNIHLSGTFRLLCFQMSNFIIRIQSTVQSAGNPRNSSIQTKIKALNCKQITLNLYVFALNSSLSAPFIKIFLLQFIPTNIHNLPQIFYFQNVNGNWIQNENVLLIEWKKKRLIQKSTHVHSLKFNWAKCASIESRAFVVVAVSVAVIKCYNANITVYSQWSEVVLVKTNIKHMINPMKRCEKRKTE